MIEHTNTQAQSIEQLNAKPQKQKRVFRMIENDRMAGSVPKWEVPKTQKQDVEQRLSLAEIGHTQESFAQALSYSQPDIAEDNAEFGFGDLIDMVNPLQHIPIVNQLYREISGDEIKPIGKIMGGAVFGGPLGAASGLADTIIEEETGKSLSGNAMAMVLDGDTPHLKAHNEHPEKRLNDAANIRDELPGSLLAFTDLKQPRDNGISIQRFEAYRIPHNPSEGLDVFRTSVKDTMEKLPAREPIQRVNIPRYNG